MKWIIILFFLLNRGYAQVTSKSVTKIELDKLTQDKGGLNSYCDICFPDKEGVLDDVVWIKKVKGKWYSNVSYTAKIDSNKRYIVLYKNDHLVLFHPMGNFVPKTTNQHNI